MPFFCILKSLSNKQQLSFILWVIAYQADNCQVQRKSSTRKYCKARISKCSKLIMPKYCSKAEEFIIISSLGTLRPVQLMKVNMFRTSWKTRHFYRLTRYINLNYIVLEVRQRSHTFSWQICGKNLLVKELHVIKLYFV